MTSDPINSSARRAQEARALLKLLLPLRAEMLQSETEHEAMLASLPPARRQSARNLLHYLTLRQHDLRTLQPRLTALGLSSLGRAESSTLANVESVVRTLAQLAGAELAPLPGQPPLGQARARAILKANAARLLGEAPEHRLSRIMITMPTEAAASYDFVRDLLDVGMECMRINCAHDSPTQWLQMIRHLQRARQELGKSCLVEMDLCGPRLRTGPMQSGVAVRKLRPKRNPTGSIVSPASVWLTEAGASRNRRDAELEVSDGWLDRVAVGDRLRFTDARGSARTLDVTRIDHGEVQVELRKTAYIVPGLEFTRVGDPAPIGKVADFQGAVASIRLAVGDELILTRDLQPGEPEQRDPDGRLVRPGRIGCTLADVFDDVRPGEPVLFDDGRIQGTVTAITDAEVSLKITRAGTSGSRLRADKGINLPASHLRLSALSDKDYADLAFVVRHADIVGMSFTNCSDDVRQLQRAIERLGPARPNLVLKIETRRGFDNLPSILLAALQLRDSGVMIARGDLAVELGFERLAEAQEEIMWLCEAAHVPVIWATQVLESLAHDDLPSRAEITDAAAADRTECVLLNKGPHILHAVRTLADILQRMQAHQTKKQSMLRELRVAHRLDRDSDDGQAAARRDRQTGS